MVCNVIDTDMAYRLQFISHRRPVAFLCFFRHIFSWQLFSCVFLWLPEFKGVTRLAIRSYRFTAKLSRGNSHFYSRTSQLYNSLPISSFAVRYNLRRFKCNVNRYPLSYWSLLRFGPLFKPLHSKASHFPSILVNPAFLSCLRWND